MAIPPPIMIPVDELPQISKKRKMTEPADSESIDSESIDSESINSESINTSEFVRGSTVRCYYSNDSTRHITAIIKKDGTVLDVTRDLIHYKSVQEWFASLPPVMSFYINSRNAVDQAQKDAEAIQLENRKKQKREYNLICNIIKKTSSLKIKK